MQFHSRELWLDYLELVVGIEMAVEEEWIGAFFDGGVAFRCGNWKATFIKLSQKPQFDETLSQRALPQQLLLPSKLCDNLRLHFAETCQVGFAKSDRDGLNWLKGSPLLLIRSNNQFLLNNPFSRAENLTSTHLRCWAWCPARRCRSPRPLPGPWCRGWPAWAAELLGAASRSSSLTSITRSDSYFGQLSLAAVRVGLGWWRRRPGGKLITPGGRNRRARQHHTASQRLNTWKQAPDFYLFCKLYRKIGLFFNHVHDNIWDIVETGTDIFFLISSVTGLLCITNGNFRCSLNRQFF